MPFRGGCWLLHASAWGGLHTSWARTLLGRHGCRGQLRGTVEGHEVARSTSLVEAVLLLSFAIFVFRQKAYRFNPRPDGVFPTLPADGGTVSPPPPPLLSATPLDRFSIRKLHLIAPGLNFPNILQDFMSLMTSQIGSKVKLWLSVLADFAGAMPKWNKSRWNDMGRVWDTSNCHPKPFVTLCQIKVIQGHQVKKSQI